MSIRKQRKHLDELMRRVNDTVGREAFARLDKLPTVEYNWFRTLLRAGRIDLHCDGHLGFTVEDDNGVWSSECFDEEKQNG